MEPESDPLVRHKHDSGEVIFSGCPNLSSISSISFKSMMKVMRYFMTANHRLALVVAANPTGELPDNLQALSSTSPDIENFA